jgi:hypothetical protein
MPEERYDRNYPASYLKRFRDDVRNLVKTQSGTVSINPDAVVITAALLTVAAVLKDSSAAHAELEEYSNEEIASMLGCCKRTIARKLALIRTIWNKEDEQ